MKNFLTTIICIMMGVFCSCEKNIEEYGSTDQASSDSNKREHAVFYYPLPIGPGFMVPQTHDLLEGKVAYGKSSNADSPWKQHDSYTIYKDVDTTSASLTNRPFYFTSLEGPNPYVKRLIGTTSLYDTTNNGFRIYVINASGNRIDAKHFNNKDIFVNWIALYNQDGHSYPVYSHKNWWGDTAKLLCPLPDESFYTNRYFLTLESESSYPYAHQCEWLSEYRIGPNPDFNGPVMEFRLDWLIEQSSSHPSGGPSSQDAVNWKWTYLDLFARNGYYHDEKTSTSALVSYVEDYEDSEYEIVYTIDYSYANFTEIPTIVLSRRRGTSLTSLVGYTTVAEATLESARVYVTRVDNMPMSSSTRWGLDFLAIGKSNKTSGCHDECSSTSCLNDGQLAICHNNDSDPCLELTIENCDSDELCALDLSGHYPYNCIYNPNPTPDPSPSKTLNFKPVYQRTPYWCWAASIEAISDYLGHKIDQAGAVMQVFGASCGNGCLGACQCYDLNTGAMDNQIEWAWQTNGFHCDYASSSITFPAVMQQIDGNKPIQTAILWKGDVYGHIQSIYGYGNSNGNQYLWVADTMYNEEVLCYFNAFNQCSMNSFPSSIEIGSNAYIYSYDAYEDNDGQDGVAGFTWEATFYNLARN